MKKKTKAIRTASTGAPSGVMVSLIFHAVIFFIAGFILFATVVTPKKIKFTPPADIVRPRIEPKLPDLRIEQSARPKPSSRIVAPLMTKNMPQILIPDLDGDGKGLLDGIGDIGNVLGLPEIPSFTPYGIEEGGVSSGTELVGILYDLKFSPQGKFTPGNPYRETFRNFIESGLNHSTLSRFYRSPKKLFSKCIVIGQEPSAMAPVAFGMPDDMASGGDWIVHYRGRLVHKEDITFRFWSASDDSIAVFVDGEIVLAGSLTDSRFYNMFGGLYSRPGMELGKYRWGNSSTTTGDWITLKAGVPRDMDIVITDNPPPKRIANCMFVLAVEVQGEEYARNRHGWPIFPIFKTAKLSHDELDLIYRGLEEGIVDCENGPVFNDFESSKTAMIGGTQ